MITHSRSQWACRAGSATPMWYGRTDQPWVEGTRRYDNLADSSFQELLVRDKGTRTPLFMPHDDKVNDRCGGSAPAAGFESNPCGLVNMHGDVREWTRSLLRPYPYRADDGREDVRSQDARVARGGSFYDLPRRATASFRIGYPAWMRPWNVGFRVLVSIRSA